MQTSNIRGSSLISSSGSSEGSGIPARHVVEHPTAPSRHVNSLQQQAQQPSPAGDGVGGGMSGGCPPPPPPPCGPVPPPDTLPTPPPPPPPTTTTTTIKKKPPSNNNDNNNNRSTPTTTTTATTTTFFRNNDITVVANQPTTQNYPLIIGVSVVSAVIAIVATVLAVVCVLRKKKRKAQDEASVSNENIRRSKSETGTEMVMQQMSSRLTQTILSLLPIECLNVRDLTYVSSGGAGRVYSTTLLMDIDNDANVDWYTVPSKGTKVALKETYTMLVSSQSGSSEFDMFLNELTLMRTLYHPNIVPFYGLYCDSKDGSERTLHGRAAISHYFLVTKFAERGTLEDHFEKPSTEIGYDIRKAWVLDIASAIQYLHGKKVIHRDIKPANVLVTESWSAQLTDFGISRAIDNSRELTKKRGNG
jgi:hypothetical protein